MSREMSKKQMHRHANERRNPREVQRGYIDKERALKSTHRDVRDQETLMVNMAYGIRVR